MPSSLRCSRAAAAAHPLVADTAAAGVLAVLGLLAVRVGIDTAPAGYRPPPTPVWVGLTLALVLPLAVRRRSPLAVLVVITAVFFPYRLTDVPDLTVSVVVWWLALYSAGAYGDPRRRNGVRALNVVAALGFLTYRLVVVAGQVVHGPLLLRAVFLVLFNVAFVVAAWMFGDVTAERREHERSLVERAAQLEREREERARRAVFDERVRIARELHDVLAHHVSVMGVQAGAARLVMSDRPARAAESLASIEATSRQAVVELHRVLGLLRQEDDPERLGPQPRLSDVDRLVAEFAETGLTVQVHVQGRPGVLPSSVEVSAYRIIQEALTNALKHSTGRHVLLRLTHQTHQLAVEVTNDGCAKGGPQGAGGHGIIGMRERVTLHGGQFTAAPLSSGGFRVSACFPIDGPIR
ncbi:sensor histidine kinase [Modestobacter excelsi]|uniref:sensor histidine kinase n=1 Tax=Modestobacter excelsi TaxID=2213161 RepID=UPI00110CAB6F|nr:sensor histidine kinase [Modestobacter excelsi]